MCFWEAERGYLFSGDLVYRGTLFACYPSTNPEEYLSSLERTACLPMERLLPAHHALDIGPELLGRVRESRESSATAAAPLITGTGRSGCDRKTGKAER